MPVIAMPTSAPLRALMPAAMACATGSLTAPCASISARIDAEQVDLRLVAVADDPAGDVVRAAGNVGQARQQQAAGARLGRREMPAALAQEVSDTCSMACPASL